MCMCMRYCEVYKSKSEGRGCVGYLQYRLTSVWLLWSPAVASSQPEKSSASPQSVVHHVTVMWSLTKYLGGSCDMQACDPKYSLWSIMWHSHVIANHSMHWIMWQSCDPNPLLLEWKNIYTCDGLLLAWAISVMGSADVLDANTQCSGVFCRRVKIVLEECIHAWTMTR